MTFSSYYKKDFNTMNINKYVTNNVLDIREVTL